MKNACKKIAKKIDKTVNTIRKHYHRNGGGSSGKEHDNRKLSKEQENILLSIIVVYSLLHMPIVLKEIQSEVLNLFNVEVSYKWALRFSLQHQNEIKQKKTKLLASKRADDTIVQEVAEFVAQLESVQERWAMWPELVVNYDETRVYVSNDGTVCLEHVSKGRGQMRGPKGKTIGSLVSFVAADGSVIMSLWIFKAAESKEDEGLLVSPFHIPCDERSSRGKQSWKRFFAFTKTGYTNKELHKQTILQFGKIWKELHETDMCWLFSDQLQSHKCPETVISALEYPHSAAKYFGVPFGIFYTYK